MAAGGEEEQVHMVPAEQVGLAAAVTEELQQLLLEYLERQIPEAEEAEELVILVRLLLVVVAAAAS
jgi:hypothetical protein